MAEAQRGAKPAVREVHASVTAIRVLCRSCGVEINSAEVDRGMRCVPCAARALVAPELAEYRRLWAKRTRYLRGRAALGGLPDQLGRLVQRIARRLHERIRDPEQAVQVLNGALEEARQQADSAGGRILVPRHGQEIVGEGARA